jgi:hypothetical protein
MKHHIHFLLIAAAIIFLFIELNRYGHKKNVEAFTNDIRGFKNRNKRKLRRAVRDGFTQMKSLLG